MPTPIPELEDLLAGGRLRTLARELKVWALNKRKPWFHLLFEAARGFFPPSLLQTPKYRQPPPWLDSAFARRNRAALEGYESRLKLLGPRPSFQSSLATLDGLRRQIGCSVATRPRFMKNGIPISTATFWHFSTQYRGSNWFGPAGDAL